MSENKGKPSQQKVDERKEMEKDDREENRAARRAHRADRSREMETSRGEPKTDVAGTQRPPSDS